jgi:hypothetical protein
VVQRLTKGKSRVESLSDLPLDGLLVNLTGQGKNGFYVVDIFESEEAVRPLRRDGHSHCPGGAIEEPPEFFPAHTAVAEGPPSHLSQPSNAGGS